MTTFYPPAYAPVANPAKYASVESLSRSPSPERPGLDRSARELARTPSPTPSEEEALHPVPFDLRSLRTKEFWFSKAMIIRVVIITVAVLFTLLFTVFRKPIAKALTPAANSIHNLPAGWLIPIGIMIIISFPPLFGHEIIAIMCGLVWGIGAGFAIVAAGTFLGELANFFVFRYCCAARGAKLEKTSLKYATMAAVVRTGGFKVILIMRYSAIPSHFSTAVFSFCGVAILPFCIAVALSLPSQLATVLLGYTLNTEHTVTHADNILQDVVIVATVAATSFGLHYIKKRSQAVLPDVVRARRKARQAELQAKLLPDGRPSFSSDVYV